MNFIIKNKTTGHYVERINLQFMGASVCWIDDIYKARIFSRPTDLQKNDPIACFVRNHSEMILVNVVVTEGTEFQVNQ